MLEKAKAWCHYSETVAWSRVKVGAGLFMLSVMNSGADLHAILHDDRMYAAYQIFSAWLMMDGGFSEFARRRRAQHDDDGSLK